VQRGHAAAREVGVVYTKPWVVELVLDLAGYVPDRRLADLVALEPFAGDGAWSSPASGMDLPFSQIPIIHILKLETGLRSPALPQVAGILNGFAHLPPSSNQGSGVIRLPLLMRGQ
jgi:hypothetical protein